MRWQGRRQSDNVEDRRRTSAAPVVIGGGLGTLVLIVIVMLLGGDPQAVLQQLPPPGQQPGGAVQSGAPLTPQEEQAGEFVRTILAETEDVWTDLFREQGLVYQEPTLVMFKGQVQSACGFANAAVGPFYCPADRKAYIDLAFYDELASRFQAPGDFAQAYVLAHEIGHHVQNLLGTTDRVHAMQGRISQEEYNRLSVRLELQADFLAGVWAHHAERRNPGLLEEGDLEEGLRAAAAIGDDRLQEQARGVVVPDSFTHGSSEQRVRWFRKGLATGDLSQGDTFATDDL